MTKQYKLRGINADHDTCEICGKTNLKKVMWLVELDPDGGELGQPFAAGTTCGAKLLGLRQRNEAKISRTISEMAAEQVKARIAEIFESMTLVQRFRVYLPRELVKPAVTNEITIEEATRQRNEMYPILNYQAGRLTLEEAIKYC